MGKDLVCGADHKCPKCGMNLSSGVYHTKGCPTCDPLPDRKIIPSVFHKKKTGLEEKIREITDDIVMTVYGGTQVRLDDLVSKYLQAIKDEGWKPPETIVVPPTGKDDNDRIQMALDGYVKLPSVEEIQAQWLLANKYWNFVCDRDLHSLIRQYGGKSKFVATWLHDWLKEANNV